MEAPQGDARAAERQPVFEEEGAGGGDALFALLIQQYPSSSLSLVVYHFLLPPPYPFLALLHSSVKFKGSGEMGWCGKGEV